MKTTTAISKFIAIGLMLTAVLSGVANAQKATTRQPMKPQVVSATRSNAVTTKREQAQLERVHSYLASLEPKMMAGLKKSKAVNAMAQALQAIAATKDYNTRVKMAKDYQRRYREAYGQAMLSVGLDFRALASEMRRMAPDFNVESTQNFGFKLTPKDRSVEKPAKRGGTNPASGVTTVTRLTDFDTYLSPVGVGLGLTQLIAEDDRVSAAIFSILAGFTDASALSRKEVSVPSDAQSAALRLRGTAKVDSFAIALLGVSTVSGYATVVVRNNSDDSPNYALYTSVISFAPILWVMHNSQERTLSSLEMPLEPGERYSVQLQSSATGFAALPSESNATARVDDVIVELVMQR